MAKQRRSSPNAAVKAVTPERAARLVRLLRLLGKEPRARAALTKKLRLDVRGFYRDLDLLRSAGIPLVVSNHRYTLQEEVETAVARLPFPDPRLTLGEARQLAPGRSAVHRKLQAQLRRIAGAKGSKAGHDH